MSISNLGSRDFQKGAIPILILIAVIGIISVIVVISIAPFKNQLLTSLFPKDSSQAASNGDWPQVAKDAQRTGFSAESLGSNFKVKWTFPFQPERVFTQVQPIVADNKVYVGTEMGNMYALSVTDGSKVWKYSVGSPILGSVAFDSGKIYFGAMDGAIYALNTSDGSLAWKTPASSKGFSTSTLFADSKIMLGGRDGTFYALNPADGSITWKYDAGSPILMTAAWDNGKAYFGTMDMYVHGVNTATGTGAWKSPKIKGMTFKDYWPVVTQGKVIVVPWGNLYIDKMGVNPGSPFTWFGNATIPALGQTDWQWLTANGPTVAAGNLSQIPYINTIQDNILNAVAAAPQNFSPGLNILDENSGQVAFNVVHNDGISIDGAKAPPCIDRDGKLIFGTNFTRGMWGRIDLNSKKIVDILYDGFDSNGQPFTQSSNRPAGGGNIDENMAPTCAQNMVMVFHNQEENANYTGYFNQDTRRWKVIPRGARSGQMSENTQGGGTSVAAISNGVVYHITSHELIARTTN